jgi:hypothetical protein
MIERGTSLEAHPSMLGVLCGGRRRQLHRGCHSIGTRRPTPAARASRTKRSLRRQTRSLGSYCEADEEVLTRYMLNLGRARSPMALGQLIGGVTTSLRRRLCTGTIKRHSRSTLCRSHTRVQAPTTASRAGQRPVRRTIPCSRMNLCRK